jgi:hypothetical protein
MLSLRIQALEGFQDIVLVDRGILLPCRAPGAHHDLRRADQCPHLIDHRRLYLPGRHAPHRAGVGVMAQPVGPKISPRSKAGV